MYLGSVKNHAFENKLASKTQVHQKIRSSQWFLAMLPDLWVMQHPLRIWHGAFIKQLWNSLRVWLNGLNFLHIARGVLSSSFSSFFHVRHLLLFPVSQQDKWTNLKYFPCLICPLHSCQWACVGSLHASSPQPVLLLWKKNVVSIAAWNAFANVLYILAGLCKKVDIWSSFLKHTWLI